MKIMQAFIRSFNNEREMVSLTLLPDGEYNQELLYRAFLDRKLVSLHFLQAEPKEDLSKFEKRRLERLRLAWKLRNHEKMSYEEIGKRIGRSAPGSAKTVSGKRAYQIVRMAERVHKGGHLFEGEL